MGSYRMGTKKYEKKHIAELAYYDAHRGRIKGMITEPEKKITQRACNQIVSGGSS
jgi:hypothetical protein